jgi:hypothetical protein
MGSMIFPADLHGWLRDFHEFPWISHVKKPEPARRRGASHILRCSVHGISYSSNHHTA